jgi:hypothetical protein
VPDLRRDANTVLVIEAAAEVDGVDGFLIDAQVAGEIKH